MSIEIDELAYEELIDLNHRIVERLKLLDQLQAHNEMMQFSIGERVTFTPEGRNPVVGIISKYNRKTVTMISEDGHKWRVAPHFLHKANSEASRSNNVVDFQKNERP